MENTISVIIPVHKFDDNIKTLLISSIKSVEKQIGLKEPLKLVVVVAKKVEKNVKSFFKTNPTTLSYEILSNDGFTDFQSQINFAVSKITTPYFSILEFDDEYSEIFFKNAEKHIEAYPNIGMFLPIILEVDSNQVPISFINESVWSRQFVGDNGKIGYLSINALKEYTNFKICGAVIKTSAYLYACGLKKNITLTFILEFMLRFMNTGFDIYTIPKLGYKHVLMREDSLFFNYNNTLNANERMQWFDIALKEYNFNSDREIVLQD